jgi:trans-aconitate methyltransferase
MYRVPPNCFFEINDFESDWDFSKPLPFDFIHARNLVGSVRDFPLLFQRMMNNLQPGGWVEMMDFSGERFFSDDETVQNAPQLNEFVRLLNEACHAFGKEFGVTKHYKQWMIDAGFKNVKEEVYKVCLSDPRLLVLSTGYIYSRD